MSQSQRKTHAVNHHRLFVSCIVADRFDTMCMRLSYGVVAIAIPVPVLGLTLGAMYPPAQGHDGFRTSHRIEPVARGDGDDVSRARQRREALVTPSSRPVRSPPAFPAQSKGQPGGGGRFFRSTQTIKTCSCPFGHEPLRPSATG